MRLEKFKSLSEEKQTAIIAAGIEEFSQKSYPDASTDTIVQRCSISKGLLFHYFGSKKDFYFYCLSNALQTLLQPTSSPQGSFYDILFEVMDEKLRLCAQYPTQTKFVNLASREAACEVAGGKAEIFAQYAAQTHTASSATMEQALATLPLREHERGKVKQGLLLYINAVIGKYLLLYQNTPDAFFANAPQIQEEIREYINLMLYGVLEQKQEDDT